MKQITIIRHAKSCWEDATLPDIVRPLNQRGRDATVLVGSYLKEKHIIPDYILSSPATRALHTAFSISDITGFDIAKLITDASIYFGNAKKVVKLIEKIPDRYNNVFLFGHEPVLSDVIELLTNDVLVKFPTCAACNIIFETETWSKIESGKRGFYIFPKMLE
jgi:phosphohistidine phosphatase